MKSLNKSNLSSKHWKAIFELKKDASIVIKPADKGNKTLVYNQPDDIAKLDNRISKGSNHKIKCDPTAGKDKRLNKLIADIMSKEDAVETVDDSSLDPDDTTGV